MQFPYVYGQNISSEYSNVAVSIERITPSIAEKMLETNVRNRSMKKEPLKKAILSGEWLLNGAPIVFSNTGVLLDGQNRLRACIDANSPIDAVVVRGIQAHAQETMDVGVKRNLQDWAKMNGYPNQTVACAVSIALQRADAYGIEGAFNYPNGDEATLVARTRFFANNYESRIRPLSLKSQPLAAKFKHTGNGMWAAVIEQLQNNASEDDVDTFFKQLTGEMIPCESVLTLRNRLEANAQSKTGWLPMKTVAAFVIKSFNAYMRGEDIKCLKFTVGGAHPEDFPTVYSDGQEVV